MLGAYYEDYGSGSSRWLKVAVIGTVGASIVAGGFWMMTREGATQPGAYALPPVTAVGNDAAAVTTAPPPTTATATTLATASTAATTAPAPSMPAPSASATSAASAVAAAAAPAPTTEAPALATAAAPGPGYPTSDDGAPLPVIVTYDVDTIKITGFVPSQAAKDRVGLLASANSKTEARLENNLVVNADVPIGVGIRVIELNSVRFPDGSSEILSAHAAELERVAAVMKTLPNITALVIGHADQRGDEASNYAISAERAEAVVDFLTYLGVSPTRLSSRAVGEADLLTLDDDGTALALNRRTEFIFYGVLIE